MRGGFPAGGRLVAGLDEAGRGPVLGPLVVACAITRSPLELSSLGVRDSKQLTAPARERLEEPLKARLAGYFLIALTPEEIDRERGRRSLNAIEGDAFVRAFVGAAAAAGARGVDVLQADAADAKETNFRAMLVRGLAAHPSPPTVDRFEVEHKADERHPAVAAASILAKVERDRRVKRIEEEWGCAIGSGYPADPITIGFLRDYIRANKDLPPFARRSWKTAKALMREGVTTARPLEQFATMEDDP